MKRKTLFSLLLTALLAAVCMFAVACKPDTPDTPVDPNPPVDIPPAILEEGPETGVYYHTPSGGGV